MAKGLRKGFGLVVLTFVLAFGLINNVSAANNANTGNNANAGSNANTGNNANAGSNAKKVMCPKGSLRENAEVDFISECNLAEDHAGSTDLMKTLNTIISVVVGVLGLLAVAIIIYGGFMYTTSAGDASKIKKAKDTIMYGVVGLVVALLAFAIVNFVVSSIFKSTS